MTKIVLLSPPPPLSPEVENCRKIFNNLQLPYQEFLILRTTLKLSVKLYLSLRPKLVFQYIPFYTRLKLSVLDVFRASYTRSVYVLSPEGLFQVTDCVLSHLTLGNCILKILHMKSHQKAEGA